MHADIGVTLLRHEVSRALDRVRATASYALVAVACAYLLVVGLFLWPLFAFVLVVCMLFTDTSTRRQVYISCGRAPQLPRVGKASVNSTTSARTVILGIPKRMK